MSVEIIFFIASALFLLPWFFLEQNLILKQLSLMCGMTILMVGLSVQLTGKNFSSKMVVGNFSYIEILYQIVLFVFLMFFFLRKEKLIIENKLRFGAEANLLTLLFLSTPLLLFLILYFYQNGIRFLGEFVEHRGERSVLHDYIFVYFAVCAVMTRQSKWMLLLGSFAALIHLLSAERMRAFVYIMFILIYYFSIDKKRILSTLILLVGFVLATIVGLLRTGNGLSVNEQYNITHFGSVTVSSLFLMDFSEGLNLMDKLNFFLGFLLGNIIPSSILSDEYNIRAAIFNYADIPGGGWFPSFLFVIGGWLGIFLGAIFLSSFIKILNRCSQWGGAFSSASYVSLLILIATLPRWLMYSPFQVFKMPLYGMALYLFLYFLFKKRNFNES